MPTTTRTRANVKSGDILAVARRLGLPLRHIEPHGPSKAKIRLEALKELGRRPEGKLIIVTAITPTPLGEGKTVTTISLAQGLRHIGEKAVATLRQPSMGPVFGVKGGATGGGKAEVVPADEINFHLTGDIHAVGAAHNLLAAFLDNHLHFGNRLGIDRGEILWKRAIDMNDRSLRTITLEPGTPNERKSGFEITVASEVMAILALAESYRDLRERLGRIVVAATEHGKPVTAEDLRCAGGMAVVLRDALKPNLLRTADGTPVFMHAGPFANLAHGNSSVLADRMALRCARYVVTECGFASDLGFEKFIDIKCRTSGLRPWAAVVVASARALKLHSGKFTVVSGKPLPPELREENVAAVREGAVNLVHHIENVKRTGLPAIVAVNRFPGDTPAEIAAVVEEARDAGADGVEVNEGFARGGAGTAALAREVVRHCRGKTPPKVRFYYETSRTLPEKIETVAKEVYGADGVDFLPAALARLEQLSRWGMDNLPVCMAKTQLSISDDPDLRGRPRGFRVQVSNVTPSAGAGFVVARCGSILRLPGLPAKPGSEALDIDDAGNVVMREDQ